MAPDNNFIANQFSLLSKLIDIHGENAFKSKSYSIAAFNIEKLPLQLSALTPEKIFDLRGIGDSLGKKIIEIIKHGNLPALGEMILKTPAGVLELLSIKGLGPKKIAVIWKEMEIESPGELLYACTENRLARFKGFGQKSQQSIQSAIEFYQQSQGSQLFAAIEPYALQMTTMLKKAFPEERFEITGDFRRQALTIDKLEWVTTLSPKKLQEYLINHGFAEEEILSETSSFRSAEKILLQFYSRPESLFYFSLFETTGSKIFLDQWATIAKKDSSAFSSEEEIFKAHGLSVIPPFLRENPSVIEAAGNNSFVDLIRPTDIKGIIHSHSDWSDGSRTIEEMVKSCVTDGYEYLVISDHSKSAGYANGLSEERIKEQHLYIDELNKKYAPFRVFKSIESDILGDGSLDYSDKILSTFDLVIASVHSNIKMQEEKAMTRLLHAISNPYTTILGHMTGRLLLSRPGYPIDHQVIIDACAKHNVAIEINANPRRLDMHWEWVDYALRKNVLLSINPDAHDTKEYGNCRFGVLAAQKGGLKKENNLSSFSLQEFEKYLAAK
jgi:DNA polymerase (family 10)